jgi:hypothetical protein
MSNNDSTTIPGTPINEWLEAKKQEQDIVLRRTLDPEGDIQINMTNNQVTAKKVINGQWQEISGSEGFAALREKVAGPKITVDEADRPE